MEIFTKEFREELFDSLETISLGLKKDLPIQKTNELTDKINLALQNEMKHLKPKKKKKKKFEVGDVVYLGILIGKVIEQNNDNSNVSLEVKFDNGKMLSFTKDGRFYEEMPILISHFPYELKMKKIKK